AMPPKLLPTVKLNRIIVIFLPVQVFATKKSNHLLSIGTGSVIQRFALTQNPEIFKEVAQSATSLNISVLLKASIGCMEKAMKPF
ncbi:MAG: hypothetical protein ACK451_06060, partial [Pseudanabaena sp.]